MIQKFEISWLLLDVEASKIFFHPATQLQGYEKNKPGVLSCPAVLTKRQRNFTIKAPFDLKLRFTGTISRPEIRPVYPGSSITPDKLQKIFTLSPREQWISDDYPVFQITTPYVFWSDVPCYINQVFPRELIGFGTPFRLIEGRFPIHAWKRPLSWAIEWLDLEKDIVVKRGKPWFDLFFETNDPSNSIRLVNKEITAEMKAEIFANHDVTSYIKGTSQLFEV